MGQCENRVSQPRINANERESEGTTKGERNPAQKRVRATSGRAHLILGPHVFVRFAFIRDNLRLNWSSMPSSKNTRELDLSAFPPGTVTEYATLVCLACIFDIFTTQLHLAPRSAYSEIKRYSPTI